MTTTSIYKSTAGRDAMMAIYETALQNWPVPHEELSIDTHQGETFVIASGPTSGAPLVLLHGAATNSAAWAGDFPIYSRTFRTYAVDTIGEPGKSAESRPAWDKATYALWLSEVFEALGLGKASLVGISQGGWMALNYATTYPERVERLVLLCPAGLKPVRASFILRGLTYTMLGRWGAERVKRLVLGDVSVPDEVHEFMTLCYTEFKNRTDVPPLFSDDELSRLYMPVLFLGGDQDALIPVEAAAERLEPLLPNLTVTIYPGQSHALINAGGDILNFLNHS